MGCANLLSGQSSNHRVETSVYRPLVVWAWNGSSSCSFRFRRSSCRRVPPYHPGTHLYMQLFLIEEFSFKMSAATVAATINQGALKGTELR